MAVDPATLKAIATAVQQAIKTITDEEKRNKLIITAVTLLAICISIILIPIYLLTHPIDTIKMIVTGELDLSLITQLKQDYPVQYQYGELTFKGKFPFPLQQADKYVVTSIYGTRIHPIRGVAHHHSGIDLVTVHHDNILSIADGIVTFAGSQSGYGNCIEIKHNIDGEEFYSFYAHLSRVSVVSGLEVTQGQVIGLEGGDPKTDPNVGSSTGHHLHFEIRTQGGSNTYAIDPAPYILDI